MPSEATETATEWREIDRFEAETTAGFGWMAHPDEAMQRASHALAVDGDVWIVDPVDAPGVDDLLAEFGDVAGVAVLLDRHTRDSAAVANRHDVPVYLPEFMRDTADEIDASIELFDDELDDTGYVLQEIVDNFAWREAALSGEDGTLVVPEAVGTASFFLAGDERLGVHPALRLTPPKSLARLDPERIFVGHGAGVNEDAAATLEDALAGSRRRAPEVFFRNLRIMLPG